MKQKYFTPHIDIRDLVLTDIVTASDPYYKDGNSSQNKTPILSGSADKGSMPDVYIG